jgi:hypothetical protein
MRSAHGDATRAFYRETGVSVYCSIPEKVSIRYQPLWTDSLGWQGGEKFPIDVKASADDKSVFYPDEAEVGSFFFYESLLTYFCTMRILYLTHELLDYLSDEVLYGLRTHLGENVVDYPKKEILYRSSKGKVPQSMVWANGATAFGLPDLAVDREDIENKISAGYFDVIINSNCWRIHSPVYTNLVVLDGQDHHLLNPTYVGRAIAYCKRELLRDVPNVQPIQFSFPDHLVDFTEIEKTKLIHASFSLYPGLRQEIADMYGSRLIDDWTEYMHDIKRSWFGISPKGAGYDCQRHYEILGNAVLCMYSDRNAPRILREQFVDGDTCLTFGSLKELKYKIEHCSDRERLLHNGRAALLEKHLSSKRAEQLMDLIVERKRKIRRYHFYSAVRYAYLPYYSQTLVERTVKRLLKRK